MKVFNFWGKMIRNKWVNGDNWWNADWYKELADGKAAMVVSGGWYPEWLQLNCKVPDGLWRVALVPQWDASKPQNGEMGGSGFYVSSQSKNPEAAALFVLWLNSHKDSLVALHDKSQLPILWSNTFTKVLAPELANQPYPYFGGQKVTPVSVEAMKQVKTAFTALPIMDYVSSSYNDEFQKFAERGGGHHHLREQLAGQCRRLHEEAGIQQPRGRINCRKETELRRTNRSVRNHRAAPGRKPRWQPPFAAGVNVRFQSTGGCV